MCLTLKPEQTKALTSMVERIEQRSRWQGQHFPWHVRSESICLLHSNGSLLSRNHNSRQRSYLFSGLYLKSDRRFRLIRLSCDCWFLRSPGAVMTTLERASSDIVVGHWRHILQCHSQKQ